MDISDKRIRKILLYGIVIFFVGGFGGLITQKYIAPFLVSLPVFRNFGFLRADGPVVITKTELIRVNENVRLTELAKELTPRIVLILGGTGEAGKNFEERVRGTGLIISADGIVATDRSLISDKRYNYFAITSDSKVLPLNLVADDPKSDMVLAQIKDGTLSAINFGLSYELTLGQQLVVLSGTETSNLSQLLVPNVTRAPGDFNLTSIFSSEGTIQNFAMSDIVPPGAGIFNLSGQLVGMGLSDGVILSAEAVKSGVDSYFGNNEIVRPLLGINYVPFGASVSKILGLKKEQGILVRGIDANSPASKGGLQAGDIIFRINNEEVIAKNTLDVFLNRYKPGDKWTLSVLRGEREITIEVVLAKMK